LLCYLKVAQMKNASDSGSDSDLRSERKSEFCNDDDKLYGICESLSNIDM